ncbi:MAG: cytochrome c1 [Gammaproteobacteria bacterium]|nr:MAG: cytochrome c1 [Gammaproteobacteria bacterium]
MKKVIIGLFLLMVSPLALAAGGAHYMYKAPNIDETDKAAIQRGARVFVNYCLTCHSAEYMRYKRISDDLGISEELMKGNLMFASDKIHEGMQVAIEPDDAKRWFGVQPPDLSVTARARGVEWLYNYFMTFYRDDSRDIGVNNVTFAGAAMPHVLWELQGWQEPVYETVKDHDGKETQQVVSLQLVEPGKLTEKEYKRTVRDLITFMVYMGEPAGLQRHRIGFWVLAFLFVLLVLSYVLKREYWKDIH